MLNQDQDFDELSQKTSAAKLFYKKLSIKAGIFCGILAVFFGILVLFSLLGRTSWKNGLSHEIEKVLAEKNSDWTVVEYVHLDSSITVNCAVYKAANEAKKVSDAYAVIIRMPSLYGPVAAVYIYDTKKSEADFMDFAQINDRIKEPLNNAALKSQVEYWAKKIPGITAKGIIVEPKTEKAAAEKNKKASKSSPAAKNKNKK